MQYQLNATTVIHLLFQNKIDLIIGTFNYIYHSGFWGVQTDTQRGTFNLLPIKISTDLVNFLCIPNRGVVCDIHIDIWLGFLHTIRRFSWGPCRYFCHIAFIPSHATMNILAKHCKLPDMDPKSNYSLDFLLNSK